MRKDKRKKIILIGAIFLISVLIAYSLPLDEKGEYIYAHLFYIPAIITASWFYFHAFWLVGFFSVIMVFYFHSAGYVNYLPLVFFQALIYSAAVLLVIFLTGKNNKWSREKPEIEQGSSDVKNNLSKEHIESNEDRNEKTLRDVYHRVKNNMQIMTSLISLQIVKEVDESVKAALIECHNRVKAVSIIHEKLYSSETTSHIEMRGYVESLASSLLRAYRIDKDKIRVVIEMEPVRIDLDCAIPLSQIINEILTNSLKHGFTARNNGTVVIKLQKDNRKDGFFILHISDNGNGLPPYVSYPEKGKLGFNLINGLAKQLGGDMKTDFSSGTSFELCFRAK